MQCAGCHLPYGRRRESCQGPHRWHEGRPTPKSRQYTVHVVGRITAIREGFHAISVERRIRHTAVLAVANAARAQLFTA